MMFGCPMRLPFELKTNPFTGIPQHVQNENLGEFLPEDSREEIVEKFNTIDKIRGVIHDAASDEIARSQLKQAKYYDSRHCGSKLSVGDKVLHYNHKAAQCQGDKTAPKWIEPNTIVKIHDKGNYTVKDKNGKQLATKVCASNLKLWQEPIASDFLPDWIKPSQIPDTVDTVQEELDRNKKDKKVKRKKDQLKKAKPNGYLKKLYGDDLPPPPCERQDPVEHITPNVFRHEHDQSSENTSRNDKKVQFADNIAVHTFPATESMKNSPQKAHRSSSSKQKLPLREGLRSRAKILQDTPLTLKSTSLKLPANTESKEEMKRKKDKFFSSMITSAEHLANNDTSRESSDLEVVGCVNSNGFKFRPLSIDERKAICRRLNMPFRKPDLNHDNIGENLGQRNPKVKIIVGDGNCLFRAFSVAVTGWETAHLAFRQLICEHISEVGTYTKKDPTEYFSQTNMTSLGVYGSDVEIMAAAQILGCDIYVYHMYGDSLKWLRFPCKHSSGLESSAIYLDNRTGDGNTGHFDYVCGLF
ncbi:MAG: hypothetical protein MJE68_03860 [Proteobacteria bacterium]|nr:hypothetical protein [Pseudomonadota bacterium]